MTSLHFDCFNGISGDMILGSLLDIGLPLDRLRSELSRLGVGNFSIEAKKVVKSGISSTKCDVVAGHEHTHRHLHEVERIISASTLNPSIKERAILIFRMLAQAEAKVHGTTPERIHFHEVGAIDAIVDVVGACVGFDVLGVDHISCSPLNVGSGFVDCAHGTMPVPAPATAELLKGKPIYSNQIVGELVTPTGAAIVTTVAREFGPIGNFRIDRIGYGAGSKDFKGTSNVLRALLGERTAQQAAALGDQESRVMVIEANIDDMNPQLFGHVQEQLLDQGALDVLLCPVQMKKGRPGVLLTVVAPISLRSVLTRRIFAETSTIGIRYYECDRTVLDRKVEMVDCELGRIAVKVSRLEGKIVNFAPEYEDCRRVAAAQGVPCKWVQSRVIQEFLNQHPDSVPAKDPTLTSESRT